MTVALVIAGLVLALLVVLVVWARRGVAAARAELDRIGGERSAVLRSSAQSFGIKSKGPLQLRGLGYLALFDDELVFVQAIAKNHVRVKVADLVGVSSPRGFLGKSTGKPLLAVEWRTKDGATDQFAASVADLDAWRAALVKAGVAITDDN